MELAEAGAQGLALAVASGALFGAAALQGNAGVALAAIAVVLGAFLYGMSLADAPDDHPAWPGWLIGAPVAALAYFTLRDVASVASQRAGEGGAGGVAFLIGLLRARARGDLAARAGRLHRRRRAARDRLPRVGEEAALGRKARGPPIAQVSAASARSSASSSSTPSAPTSSSRPSRPATRPTSPR